MLVVKGTNLKCQVEFFKTSETNSVFKIVQDMKSPEKSC